MLDRFQPLAVTKLAIVGAAFLIAGAGLLFHGPAKRAVRRIGLSIEVERRRGVLRGAHRQ
jgi:hypothetical protein